MLHSIDGISCFSHSPLHVLSLSNNSLEFLPDEVDCCQYCSIEITQLTEIQTLYLEDNRFTSFPSVLLELRQLQHLYLSENDIQSLPDFPNQWEQLEVLYLANCGLTVRMDRTFE